uniref:recombinase family protein n=1 Tax=Pelagibacterium sp. TaxID=1967288 RepID=UPI003BAAD232
VEQVDRLTRLNAEDWEALKAEIRNRKVKVVALDLPTSHQFTTSNSDEVTARIFDSINGMMLDVLAAVARKDYDDRRRRQAEGIEKAKKAGQYRGRREDEERNRDIMRLLAQGTPWKDIQRIYERPVLKRGKQVLGKDGKPRTTTVSKVTISKLKKRLEGGDFRATISIRDTNKTLKVHPALGVFPIQR